MDCSPFRVLPKCASETLRVYCHVPSGLMVYAIPTFVKGKGGQETKINSIGDIRNECARVGLEPLVPHGSAQIKSITVALKQMGSFLYNFSTNRSHNVPQAFY